MRWALCALLLLGGTVGGAARAAGPDPFRDTSHTYGFQPEKGRRPGLASGRLQRTGVVIAGTAAVHPEPEEAGQRVSPSGPAELPPPETPGEASPHRGEPTQNAPDSRPREAAGTGGGASLADDLPGAKPPAPERDDTPQKDRGFDAIAIPLVSFNSDQGWGLGGVAGAYFYSPGFRPYRHALALQTFFTSRGVQNHFLRYDGPDLLGPVRVEARLEYRREFLAPFFGPGNLSAPEFKGDMEDPRFNYERFSPAAWVRFRWRPVERTHPLELYAGYAYRQMSIRTYDGSLLEEEDPRGSEGGPNGQLWTGAIWDTRNEEGDPTRGSAQELSLRAAHRSTLSRYGFAGVTLSDRRYYTLSPRWVFAQRLVLDALFGDVPFFEWPNIGGMAYTEGVGGLSSVRGVPRNRFAGNIKVISNSELRFGFAQWRFLDQPIRFGVVGFVDVGRVWHPDVDDGPWHAWHPGVGLGLRAARRAAVVRADYAFAPELRRGALYVTFGHMF